MHRMEWVRTAESIERRFDIFHECKSEIFEQIRASFVILHPFSHSSYWSCKSSIVTSRSLFSPRRATLASHGLAESGRRLNEITTPLRYYRPRAIREQCEKRVRESETNGARVERWRGVRNESTGKELLKFQRRTDISPSSIISCV